LGVAPTVCLLSCGSKCRRRKPETNQVLTVSIVQPHTKTGTTLKREQMLGCLQCLNGIVKPVKHHPPYLEDAVGHLHIAEELKQDLNLEQDLNPEQEEQEAEVSREPNLGQEADPGPQPRNKSFLQENGQQNVSQMNYN